MKKFLLLTFLFCYSLMNAQISFEKGYFISNDNKKTECYIKNVDWNYNPIEFKYKINIEDSNVKTETIANVKEFGINDNNTYQRAKVNIDISSSELERLSVNKNPDWKEDLIFLKVLVKGDTSLYQYVNPEMTRFFYETKNSQLEQLVYKEYFDQESTPRTAIENNYYRQQLLNNVKSENITDNDIKRVIYKRESLMKYFLKYNNVSTKEIENTITSANKSIYLLKVTAGVGFSSISIDATGGYSDVQYDKKTILRMGLEGELILPFNKNKWSLFVNPTYEQYEDQQDFGLANNRNNGGKTDYSSEVKYSSIVVPVGARYYFFLNNTSKIFINAGYTLNIGGKFKYTAVLLNFDSNPTGSFFTGLGYNFKNKLSAEVRANVRKDLINGHSSFVGNYKSLDVVLAYTIF
ncbi:hypothetical protein ACFFLS_01190 [Flavobacterium procerum]|uniref:Outer membrane protein beta-barrel domain-containing protein n=1 Tax=Flavobacterium procerum TaxID=1455569 RepID=A0ABV6BJL9_9FLAO